eukprot:scaffold72376_cov30-Tisochrysis_lutea.AAC.1
MARALATIDRFLYHHQSVSKQWVYGRQSAVCTKSSTLDERTSPVEVPQVRDPSRVTHVGVSIAALRM